MGRKKLWDDSHAIITCYIKKTDAATLKNLAILRSIKEERQVTVSSLIVEAVESFFHPSEIEAKLKNAVKKIDVNLLTPKGKKWDLK